jgi:hypothetical protein
MLLDFSFYEANPSQWLPDIKKAGDSYGARNIPKISGFSGSVSADCSLGGKNSHQSFQPNACGDAGN